MKKILTLTCCIILLAGSLPNVNAKEATLPNPADAEAVQAYIDSLSLIEQCTLYAASNKTENYIETAIEDSPFSYEITPQGITITGYQGECSGIVIIAPSYTINGQSLPVTKIGYRAFYKQIAMTAVILPENLTNIGRAAFMDCVSLQIVYLPSSTYSIYDYAFRNCIALSDVYYPNQYTEWNAMQIGEHNTLFIDATRHYANCP